MPEVHRDLVWYFMAGGWPMYPLVFFGFLFVVAALAALGMAASPRAAKGALVVGVVAAAGGVLVTGVGMAAASWGRTRVMEAVAMVNPDDRQALMREGLLEASVPQTFGLYVGVPILALGAIAAGVGASRRAKPASSPSP